MQNYLSLLQEIVDEGEWKEPAREGMPRTKELFNRTLRFDLQKGFPLLTTKKMFFKGILIELLWFLKGDTNIKYLLEHGVHIWDSDCYKLQVRKGYKGTQGEMVEEILNGNTKLGECGNIYGKQWRDYGGLDKNGVLNLNLGVDQIKNLIYNINTNPNSRYHLVTSWNPIDFIQNASEVALPACHILFQCNIRQGKYLDLAILQRSCDTFLGVPFNIASYAILIHILAYSTGYLPGELIWTGNSVHIYENHLEAISTQLNRTPLRLPTLKYEPDGPRFLSDLNPSDFHLLFYNPHPAIKASLSVGV